MFKINIEYYSQMIFKTVLIALELFMLVWMIFSLVCSFIYIIDILLGNSYKDKNSKIRKIKFVIPNKIKNYVSKRNKDNQGIYLRYECPFVIFNFSVFTIVLLENIFHNKFGEIMSFVMAYGIYVILYFWGMYRKLGKIENGEKYDQVLENNRLFLELSFVPLSFFVTIAGFVMAIKGQFEKFLNIYISLNDILNFFNYCKEGLGDGIIVHFGVVLLLCLISLPFQFMGYFVIKMIRYFQRYGTPYKRLLKISFKKFIACIK